MRYKLQCDAGKQLRLLAPDIGRLDCGRAGSHRMLRNNYCAGEWVVRRCGTLLGYEVTIVYRPCDRVVR